MEWLESIGTFFNSGIYEWMTETFSEFVEWAVIAKIKFMTFMTVFAWDVASNVLANVGISQQLNQAWGSLDSTFLSHITFFRLPECFNIILQGGATKFVLRFLGL
jgi:hypothetical protein